MRRLWLGRQLKVLAIPLLGSSKATTQVALQFIYQHCVLVKHEVMPQVCNREEAEDLMQFAHRWNIQFFSDVVWTVCCATAYEPFLGLWIGSNTL